MKQIKAQGGLSPDIFPCAQIPHNVCRSPFLWHFVMLGAIRHHIWHNGIAETAFVLVHKNRLTAMMRKVIFQVTAKV